MTKPHKNAYGEQLKRQLTPAQRQAISTIGRHRKTFARYGKGKDISTRMFNTLKAKRLVMVVDEHKKTVMLTYPGECVFTALHPYSKYAIN